MKFLTKKEVAKVLRVSVRTITDYNSKGLLPQPKRFGRSLLWDEGELYQKVGCSVSDTKTVKPVRATRGRPRKIG